MNEVEIAGRKVGLGHPCFIIAEAGVNHNGSLALAKELLDVAADAGADAVKFQTFKAERVAGAHAPKAAYQMKTTDISESQVDMLRRLELSPEAHAELQGSCRRRGVLFMSTPFDPPSADLLEELGVPVFKIGSGELTNWPFLEYVAGKKKPIILSTGMAYLSEVDDAVRVIRRAGCNQLVLLHCVSQYPASPADANLRAMHTLAAAFATPVGYSDHTLGIEVPLAAVALGACVIEKHFTLDRSLPGPDHQASLEPGELRSMVAGIRTVEAALGHGRKEPAASEEDNARLARRSLVAARDLPAGSKLSKDSIDTRRPGTGLPPAMLPYVVGRTLRIDVSDGSVLTLEMLA